MTSEIPNVAVLDDYQRKAARYADWTVLHNRAVVDFYSGHLDDQEQLVARLQEYQIICVMRERTILNQAILSRLPNLQLIVTTAMKNVAIDLEFARKRNIAVCGTNAIHTGTPELIWLHILGLARSILSESRALSDGQWQSTIGVDLHGKTLGIVGLGRIGSHVARVAAAFGMRVISWSPNLTIERARRGMAEYVDKEVLLSTSDFVVLALQLSNQTRGIIGKNELSLMKSSAFLINTSRASLVDEIALIDALKTEKIAGAGIDVFEKEPLPLDHPLRNLTNVLLTPHLGYVTHNTYKVFYSDMVKNILAWMDGSPVRVMN